MQVIPWDPNKAGMNDCVFSFSYDALKVLKAIVFAAGYINFFYLFGDESTKIEFFISPLKWAIYLGEIASFNPVDCYSLFCI